MIANGVGASLQEVVDHNHAKLVRRHGIETAWEVDQSPTAGPIGV